MRGAVLAMVALAFITPFRFLQRALSRSAVEPLVSLY